MLDKCTEACGLVAGIISAISFGTFGVPIKSAKEKTKVDPLVMQSYKSLLCFLTCWLVIPLGEPFKFTPWGIVSGLFWVPGATAGIYAIQNAGLAVSVGTWSSINVIGSFCWGILVFQEAVKSTFDALLASIILILGLIGMSVYSAPLLVDEIDENIDETVAGLINQGDDPSNIEQINGGSSSLPQDMNKFSLSESISFEDNDSVGTKDEELVFLFGHFSLTKRQLGLAGAFINGAWGSNKMIPMHYARAQGFHGAGYLISYSVGSMIVTVVLWLLRYLVNLYLHGGDYQKAFNALPSFHFRILCGPGSLAGLLYSLGNFCEIITVTALGQGVGFSFCQTSMLISGLWGIFYFGEVKGSERIFKWLMSSLVTLIGVLSLSYEHEDSTEHRLLWW